MTRSSNKRISKCKNINMVAAYAVAIFLSYIMLSVLQAQAQAQTLAGAVDVIPQDVACSTIVPTADERIFYDVAYGIDSSLQTVNIFLPETPAPEEGYPVIFGIHGGGFVAGDDRESYYESIRSGSSRGYAVIMVNYRFAPADPFPVPLEDVESAIAWSVDNAAIFNLDTNSMAIWGISAGANLALCAAMTQDSGLFTTDTLGFTSSQYHFGAVVDQFGIVDMSLEDRQFYFNGIEQTAANPINSLASGESQYLGKPLMEDSNYTQLTNPLTYLSSLDSENAPYFLIQHGTADGRVPSEQSELLMDNLTKTLGPSYVRYDTFLGYTHGDVRFNSEENINDVYEFIDKALNVF